MLISLKKLVKLLRYPHLVQIALKHRVLAGVEHRPVLNLTLQTIVDIGANRGQFALAAREFSGAHVYSFEPLPHIAEIYKKVFENDSAVKLFVSAIGPESKNQEIHISARDDSSSLLEIGKSQSELFPGTYEIGTMEIHVGRLTDFIKKNDIIGPALLKLDVQGFELSALKGCQDLLFSFQYIYCECSFVELYKNQSLAYEIFDFLNGYGYKISGVYNPFYNREGKCIQADFLLKNVKM